MGAAEGQGCRGEGLVSNNAQRAASNERIGEEDPRRPLNAARWTIIRLPVRPRAYRPTAGLGSDGRGTVGWRGVV